MSSVTKNAAIRGCIPFVIMTAISIALKYQGHDAFEVRSTFLTGLIITVVAAASVIYDLNISLGKQTLLHFGVMMITVFPCLLLSGWFPLERPRDFLYILAIFVGTGLVFWTFFYFVFQIRQRGHQR